MRSLYLRIMVIFGIALIFCSIAVWWAVVRFWTKGMQEFISQAQALRVKQAARVYETGGREALKVYLEEMTRVYKGPRFFTDANGRDLVSGLDLSRMRFNEQTILGRPKVIDGKTSRATPSEDGRYYYIAVMSPRTVQISRVVPYFIVAVGVCGSLVWAVSAGIVQPLLKVAAHVDRFGRGDLSARAHTDRRDEIGDLARSFNSMADRIETLVTAERRLLQDVSHELRSPLARLSFAVELMQTTKDPASAAERVQQEIENLTRLVYSLVEVTSAEGDPSSRKRSPVDMHELIRNTVADCTIEAAARGVRIEADIPSIAVVEGDSELLRRAIENVLRNAVRYAPEQTFVSLQMDVGSKDLEITVRDSGPGVPEDKLARIFDPFFRLEDSRDSSNGGMGLGLSIARRAILVHHGQIQAANADPGLAVRITIPIARG